MEAVDLTDFLSEETNIGSGATDNSPVSGGSEHKRMPSMLLSAFVHLNHTF